MKRLWNTLTSSQKVYVAMGAIFIAGLLIFQFVIIPMMEARNRLLRAITSQEKILVELSTLGPEYGQIKQRSEDIQHMIGRRAPNFSLFSYLEQKAGEANVKSNIRYMNPARLSATGNFEEDSVDMKLEKITLRQMIQFLHLVESRQDFIWIPKFNAEKMKENPEYLSAQIQVVTYMPVRPGVR
ncbi:MAG: hypothetical protein ABSB79_14685 [Syntrophales bacterium]|jgi:hypothetical protein